MSMKPMPMPPAYFASAPRPKRRLLLKTALAGGVLLGAAAGGGALWLRADGEGIALDTDAALDLLDVLEKNDVTGSGPWTPNQVFAHCAQSIEYAMSAYPVVKPALFQETAGAAAFAVFMRKGKMMHDPAEPLDGAPAIDAAEDFRVGLMRLRHAFINFRRYEGPLAPHYAFGKLTKEQYEAVHLMHFWNHMEQIEAAA